MIHRSLMMAALCLAASSAMAQVPPDIAAKNKAIGKNIDVPATAAIYGPLLKHEPYNVPGLQISRDIAYGAAALERLDLFTRGVVPGEGPRPVLIFVHGGGFVGGDKATVTNGVRSPTYDNLMLWSVDHGMVGININYELAPKATYPAVQKSIAAAIAWAEKNAAQHGGDPKRIFLMGHSAGGTHVAAYIANPSFYPAGGMGLKGAIITSGPLDTTSAPANPYFVPPETNGKFDFNRAVLDTKLPLLIVHAEYDPEFVNVALAKTQQAITSAAVKPRIVLAKDHGHLSETYAIGTADQTLSGPLEQFIKGTR